MGLQRQAKAQAGFAEMLGYHQRSLTFTLKTVTREYLRLFSK